MTMMMMATQEVAYSARLLRSSVTCVNAPGNLMLGNKKKKNAMHSFGLRSTWCRHLLFVLKMPRNHCGAVNSRLLLL